jgi:hypothetical protein
MYEVWVQGRLAAAAACGYEPAQPPPRSLAPRAPGAPAAGGDSGGGSPAGGASPHGSSGALSALGGSGGGGGWEGAAAAWDEGGDPFEERVSAYLENRSKRLSARLNAGVRSSLTRFQVGRGAPRPRRRALF